MRGGDGMSGRRVECGSDSRDVGVLCEGLAVAAVPGLGRRGRGADRRVPTPIRPCMRICRGSVGVVSGCRFIEPCRCTRVGMGGRRWGFAALRVTVQAIGVLKFVCAAAWCVARRLVNCRLCRMENERRQPRRLDWVVRRDGRVCVAQVPKGARSAPTESIGRSCGGSRGEHLPLDSAANPTGDDCNPTGGPSGRISARWARVCAAVAHRRPGRSIR